MFYKDIKNTILENEVEKKKPHDTIVRQLGLFLLL